MKIETKELEKSGKVDGNWEGPWFELPVPPLTLVCDAHSEQFTHHLPH